MTELLFISIYNSTKSNVIQWNLDGPVIRQKIITLDKTEKKPHKISF